MNDKTDDFLVELIDTQDIQSLLNVLAEYVGCGVAYRDVIKTRTYASSTDYLFDEKAKSYPNEEIQRCFQCFWLVENNIKCGCLILEKKEIESLVIKTALLGIRILVRQELHEQKRRKKKASNIVWDIICGKITDEATIIELMRSIGVRKNYHGLVFASQMTQGLGHEENSKKSALWVDGIEKYLSVFFTHVFFISKNNMGWCVLLFDETKLTDTVKLKNNIEAVISALINKIYAGERGSGNYIGVSSVRPSLAELSECAYEASRSVVYAKIHDISNDPVYWEKTGSFQMLFSLSESNEAKALYARVLKKLIEHDSCNKNCLLPTLAELIKNNWNIKKTAEKMKFHTNTMKYRYRKICELLEGDISDGAFRFDLDFALRLYSIYMYDMNGLMK